MSEQTNSISFDPGLEALVILMRLQGIAADAAQIKHRFGGGAIGTAEMLRCAREFNLKARIYSSKWLRLQNTPLPGIAVLREGGFLLLAKAGADKALVQRPGARPELMTQAQLEAIWTGQLVLMTRRAGLTDLARRFDLTWFLGGDAQIPEAARRGSGRVVLSAALCPRGADLLPGCHRQGARASQHDDP